MAIVVSAEVLEYRRRGEIARKAQLDFKAFIEPHSELLNAGKITYDEWYAFQGTLEYQRPLRKFWTAFKAAYPSGFDDGFQKLRSRRDIQALQAAIDFLEADPYFMWSGYIKQKFLQYIRGYQLTPDNVAALQRAILHVVDDHYCREFREYCKLARKIDNADLRTQLYERLNSSDPNISKRAKWVLDYLGTKPS